MKEKNNQKIILVAEDDSAMRSIVVKKLQQRNYLVIEASDGKTALSTCIKEKPDLVLLDLMLPEMDGFEVLLNIRNHDKPEIARTPVIALTNLYGQEDINHATSLNVQGYYVKAYLTTDEIADKVGKVLEMTQK